MAQSVLSVRMDEQTKGDFAAFCEQVGMSVSTAINVFVRQTLREGRIPFSVSVAPAQAGDARAVLAASGTLDRAAIAKAVGSAAEPFPAISKVVLFGSYARGEARPDSDIDLRIVRDSRAPLGMMNIAAFSEGVRAQTGKSIDVLSKRSIDNPELAEAVEREGVVVYERKEL